MLKRLSVLVVFALVSFLSSTFVPPAHADDCGDPCKPEVIWYWHQQQTLRRQFFAGLVRNMPEAVCIRHRESHGNYRAENSSSSASGAYQFLLGTSDSVSRSMGRYDLVGTPAGWWAQWDQDLAWAWLFSRAGWGPWGGGCRM